MATKGKKVNRAQGRSFRKVNPFPMWLIHWLDEEKTVGEVYRMKPYPPYPRPPQYEGTIRRTR